MARKATVTENMILDNAFALMQEEGFEQVTARKLAAKTGCSTQPIFRLYENMDQLIGDVYKRSVVFFENFCRFYPKKDDLPFINLGMAYIEFATAEKIHSVCCSYRNTEEKRVCMNFLTAVREW